MWLKALNIGQYIETFASNEITGSVLLELGQSDLDYMKIKALGALGAGFFDLSCQRQYSRSRPRKARVQANIFVSEVVC